MKRSREHGEINESLDMARCIMLLSHSLQNQTSKKQFQKDAFECKTCNRKFPSFQALGGHRASHKKPRLTADDKPICHSVVDKVSLSLAITKPKIHGCSICGQEFGMGQALGGHMRRHRAAAAASMTEGNDNKSGSVVNDVVLKLPLLRRSSSSKRVFGLDLNLTPLENDLKLLFMPPKVNLFS